MDSYVRSQFNKRIEGSAKVAVKLKGDWNETHWITITPEVARKIVDMIEAER